MNESSQIIDALKEQDQRRAAHVIDSTQTPLPKRKTGYVEYRRVVPEHPEDTFFASIDALRDIGHHALSRAVGKMILDGREYIVKALEEKLVYVDDQALRGTKTFALSAIVALKNYNDAEVGECCFYHGETALDAAWLMTESNKNFRRVKFRDVVLWERMQ